MPLRRAQLRVWATHAVRPLRSLGRVKACSALATQASGGSSSGRDGAAAGASGAGTATSQRLDERWERQLRKVAAFQEQHGRIPRTDGSKEEPLTEEERKLGSWCHRQRQRKKGTASPPLTQEQEAALKAIERWFWDDKEVSDVICTPSAAIGCWSAVARMLDAPCSVQKQSVLCTRLLQERARAEAEAWERQRQQVTAFQQQHGRLPRQKDSAAVPFVAQEAELGRWCKRQRERKKGKGSCSPLDPSQVTALEDLPEWWWEADPAAAWEQIRQQLAAFAQQHGRLPRQGRAGVPAKEGRLGEWCATQRQRKRGTCTPPLTVEQETALTAIPHWHWGRALEQLQQEAFQVPAAWAQQLQLVIAFQLRHGRLPGEGAEQQQAAQQQQQPAAVEGEAELATWCDEQQQGAEFTSGVRCLSAQQAAALSALPGWRWRGAAPRVARPAKLAAEWQVRLWQVAAFWRQHGRLPGRRSSDSTERQLAEWCASQRKRRKGQGTFRDLTPAQVEALESLDGWLWDGEEAEEAAWEQSLQRLAAFEWQHKRMPRRRGSKGTPLAEGEHEAGTWYNNQLRRLRGTKGFAPLSVERAEALAAVVEPVKKAAGWPRASTS